MVDKNEYAKNGYLVLRNFLSNDELDPILNNALKVFSTSSMDTLENDLINSKNLTEAENYLFELFKSDFETFVNLGKQTQHLIALWRLASSEKIEKLLCDVGLSFPNISVRPSFFFNSRFLDKVGHYWKLDSHQDWRSSQGSLDSVTIWFPYVDCDVELGALEVIPGSHLEGLYDCGDVEYYSKISKGQIDETRFIPVNMKKGDVLIFNSFLVHRSGTNSSKRIRWSSQLRYNNLNEESFVRRFSPNPYIYKPLDKLIEPGPPTKSEIIDYFKNLSKK